MAGGGKKQSKPAQNEGLRQRKPANGDGNSQRNEKPEKPVSAPKQNIKPATSSPPSGGMTCLNWFFVLVLILLASGGTFLFIHNEITMTRKLLQRGLSELRKESPGEDLKTQIQDLTKKLSILKELQGDIVDIKKNDATRAGELKQLSSDIKEAQESTTALTTHFDNTIKIMHSMKKDLDAVRETTGKPQRDEETKTELRKIQDLMAVADTNIKYLSDEVIRLASQMTANADRTSTIQQEVINLTADKVQMSSALESIKSTVVAVREKIQKQPQEAANTGEDSGAFDEKLQKLDTKMAAEIERLSGQILETSENSAQWLQEASNNLMKHYTSSIKNLTEKFNNLKVEAQEPSEASKYESLINAIAAFEERITALTESQDKHYISFMTFRDKKNDQEKVFDREYESLRDSMIKLTNQVISVKGLESEVDELTKTVTKLSNDLNSVRSISRILESRLEEVREKAKAPEEEKKSPTK